MSRRSVQAAIVGVSRMLIYKYLPDCCEQCCDYEKPDPTKDKVLIKMPAPEPEKALSKAVVQGVPITEEAKRRELQEAAKMEAAKLLDQMALIEKETREAENQIREAEELKRVKELADAIEAQEIAEAQELLEAQEASLRDHHKQNGRQPDENQKIQEQRNKEELEDQRKIDTFLKANGFSDLDSKRTKMFKSFYPLHTAVSKNNAEMVQLLLAAGARPKPKNSAGLSPLQLAQKLDKKDSHKEVIKFLTFGNNGV